MSKILRPSGLMHMKSDKLSDETCEAILLIPQIKKIKRSIPSDFFSALGHAVALYKAGQVIKSNSSTTQVNKNLGDALKHASRLAASIKGLDGNSILLMEEVNRKNIIIKDTLNDIHSILSEAQSLASEYSIPRGPLRDEPLSILGFNVSEAIREHLNLTPTQTKAGLWDAVLSNILVHELDKKGESVHRLMARAKNVKKKISQDGNIIELIPPNG